ncbi:MAG TPA: hypothetical protein VJT10_22930 [Steroidobacteraceae bacterium]|nr:hypothetical protein [Steroidobacteraceae bacterium]
MGTPRKKNMQSANPVQLDTHAAATLRYIRASMESAASLAVPGSTGIASGIVGVAAAIVASVPALRPHWLIIWLLAAAVAAGVGGALLLRQPSLSSLTIGGAPIRRFAIGLLPSLFAGAVMTWVLWANAGLHLIPGTWLLLYGCGLIAASAATARTIGILGASFVAAGLLALLLPESLQILMLGVGFGGLHIVFGYLMGRAGHGRES